MAETDLLLKADKVLTDAERAAFLARFPRLQGAHVADVLEILVSHDENLDVIEPIFEAHEVFIGNGAAVKLAVHLVAGIQDGEVAWEAVREMANRIRPGAAA